MWSNGRFRASSWGWFAKLPEVGGCKASKGREYGHEPSRGIHIRALLETQQGLQTACDARVPERDAIGKAQGAHHEIVDGPRPQPVDLEEGALGPGGRREPETLQVEIVLGHKAGNPDEKTGFLSGELERLEVVRRKVCDVIGFRRREEIPGRAGPIQPERAAGPFDKPAPQ